MNAPDLSETSARFYLNTRLYVPEVLFSVSVAAASSLALTGTCLAPKNTSVSILGSRDSYWGVAQVGETDLTVHMWRTVVLLKDNSTVSTLKYFPDIYRPYVKD